MDYFFLDTQMGYHISKTKPFSQGKVRLSDTWEIYARIFVKRDLAICAIEKKNSKASENVEIA